MDVAQTAMSFVYLVFIVSVIAQIMIYFKLDEYKRYEFHNQSEGATTFETYEDAKSFRRKQGFFQGLQRLFGIPLGFSLFIILMYWMLSK